MTPRLGLIVVAAGASRRMGGLDKVWEPLGAHPVLWYALRNLASAVGSAILVVRPDRVQRAQREVGAWFPNIVIVPGGARRRDSVRCGIEAIGDVELIAIHDAARPFARAAMLRAGVDLLEDADGAIPVEAVRDTVKRVGRNEWVQETLDRSALRAAQTPQIFRAAALLEAHARSGGADATDDSALVEAAGYRVRVFPGEPGNFKITTPHDLHVARLLTAELTCRP